MTIPTKLMILVLAAWIALGVSSCDRKSTLSYILEALELTLGRVETCEDHILAHKEELREIRVRLRTLENPPGKEKK